MRGTILKNNNKKLYRNFVISIFTKLILIYGRTLIKIELDPFYKDRLYIYYDFNEFTRTKANIFYFLNKSSFFRMKSLVEFTAVDFIGEPYRFMLVYNLLSITFNKRLSICFFIADSTYVSSLTSIYKAAN